MKVNMKLMIHAIVLGLGVLASGCTTMPSLTTEAESADVWVPVTFPHVTAWEYARLNGCVPRSSDQPQDLDTVAAEPPYDADVAVAEAMAAEAEAALDRQRRIDDAIRRRTAAVAAMAAQAGH